MKATYIQSILCALALVLGGCLSADGPPAEALAAEEVQPSAPHTVAPGSTAPKTASLVKLTLVTLGSVDADVVKAARKGIETELPVQVVEIKAGQLPQSAYYPTRSRYRAEKLLTHLDGFQSEPDARVMGLTQVDISTTKGNHVDWGIFGLGAMPGTSCVVSTYRLTKKAKNRAHALFRVTSTVVHEVGHTLGLPHCTEARCVMQDAQGSIQNTDNGTGQLGPRCQHLLLNAFTTGQLP